MDGDRQFHSDLHHLGVALNWLAAEKIVVQESLYRKVSPTNPQKVYQGILSKQLKTPTAVFDWREL